MNNRGFGLLSFMVCVALSGIVFATGFQMLKVQIAISKKIESKNQQAQMVLTQLQAIKQEFGVLNHCEFEQDCVGTPISCYAGGFLDRAIACDDEHPCVFEDGKWKRQDGWIWSDCEYGIIVKQTIIVE
jgi:hypothetical protein